MTASGHHPPYSGRNSGSSGVPNSGARNTRARDGGSRDGGYARGSGGTGGPRDGGSYGSGPRETGNSGGNYGRDRGNSGGSYGRDSGSRGGSYARGGDGGGARGSGSSGGSYPRGNGGGGAPGGGGPRDGGGAGARSDGSGRSRRTFLKLLGGAAAVSAAAVTADRIIAAEHPAHQVASRRTVPLARPRAVAENSLPGYADWQITNVGGLYDMVGFVGQTSVTQGQPVTLYASTNARSFTVKALRMGWYGGDQARLVYTSPTVKGLQQGSPTVSDGTRTVATTWGPSVTLPTDDWPAGAYLLRMDSESGAQRYVPMTVRSPSTAGKVVMKASTATWQAYNTFWGYDLYNGPAGAADYNNRSLVVSMDRPFDSNGAAMFLAHEQPLIAVAEHLGIPLAYVSSVEIDNDPQLLKGAVALVSGGHDEYWTPQERTNVTAARDAGMNIAFMGANCCFRRIRLQNSQLGAQREVVCYRTSYTEDPMYGVNNQVVTNDWREPPDPNPESSMTGTYYESNPTNADYVIATPDSWIFAGTGVQKGTSFPGMVGIEYDRVNPDVTVKRPIQVLAHSPLTCRDVHSYSDSAYYTTSSGAGVFNAGTMRFIGALDWQDYQEFGVTESASTFVRQVVTNLLRAFSEGPAAAKYPAQDNLDAMNEYAGDPIAAQHNLW